LAISAVIKKNAWQLLASSRQGRLSCPSENKIREPALRFFHEGGLITKIIVTCSCGEELELACVYKEDGKQEE